MRRLLFALIPLMIAAESGAQVVRRGRFGTVTPTVWVSGGAALAEGWSVTDGATGRWDFGSVTQYQASLEKLFNGASFGLRGTTASVPLRIQNADANATVSQLFLAVHVAPAQPGFHTVLELDGGATLYSNFSSNTAGVLLPGNDTDFSFAFGYGFGYALSNSFSVEVVRDMSWGLHQKTGLSPSDDAMYHMNSTRIVGRFGLGG